MIGCCGLNCEKCDAYIATVHNDDALRVKTAKLWSELNGIEITAEMINCTGCRGDGVKTYFCGELCEIRKCVYGKEFVCCGDCSDIKGCGKLKQILDNSNEAAENLGIK